MRRLILFRHAKAASRGPGQGDLDRPLEASGLPEAQAAGRWLAALGLGPDLVLVSPSVRTRQTWDCVAGFFPQARVEIADAIYDAAPEDIEAILAEAAPRADAIMVVGHNPGVQELALELLGQGCAPESQLEPLARGFPTSTVAVLAIPIDGAVRLEALFSPRSQAPPLVLDLSAGSGRAP